MRAGAGATAPSLIAFLGAGDAQHKRAVAELGPRLEARDRLFTSASVYAEVMVRPLQQGSDAASTRS